MGIERVRTAEIKETYGKTYFVVECPYCGEYHTHSYNCIKSYKVAKCSGNNEGYHYYINWPQ
jgi:hypothetical protein